MKVKFILWGIVLALVSVFGITLEGRAAPEAQPKKAIQTTKEPAASRWDAVLRAAKEEGSLIIYTSANPATRQALMKAMKDKYGITVDFITGRGDEFVQRVVTETRAGLYLGDLMLVGGTTLKLNPFLQTPGTMANLDSALLLPEVADQTRWRGHKFPFMDEEHRIIAFVNKTSSYVAVNTEAVKPKNIKSFYDLVDPKWKGKIVMEDPTATGAAESWSQLMLALFGTEKGREYLQQIAQQDLVILRNRRLLIEWLARNKYPIAIGADTQFYGEFKRNGAPVAYLKLSEGSSASAGAGCLAMLQRAAHPNASLVFINWLLTKEGQTIFQKAFGAPSVRLDVDMAGIEPVFIPQEGERLISATSDEWYASKASRKALVKQIFKPLLPR